jgi:hypothetical protein
MLQHVSKNPDKIGSLLGHHAERIRVDSSLRSFARLPEAELGAAIDGLIADLRARTDICCAAFFTGMQDERELLLAELQKLRTGSVSSYKAGLVGLINDHRQADMPQKCQGQFCDPEISSSDPKAEVPHKAIGPQTLRDKFFHDSPDIVHSSEELERELESEEIRLGVIRQAVESERQAVDNVTSASGGTYDVTSAVAQIVKDEAYYQSLLRVHQEHQALRARF